MNIQIHYILMQLQPPSKYTPNRLLPSTSQSNRITAIYWMLWCDTSEPLLCLFVVNFIWLSICSRFYYFRISDAVEDRGGDLNCNHLYISNLMVNGISQRWLLMPHESLISPSERFKYIFHTMQDVCGKQQCAIKCAQFVWFHPLYALCMLCLLYSTMPETS